MQFLLLLPSYKQSVRKVYTILIADKHKCIKVSILYIYIDELKIPYLLW